MRTQKHDLKDRIKKLEQDLQYTILHNNVLESKHISKKIDRLKSTLYNIQ